MNDELTYALAGTIGKASRNDEGVWTFPVSKATGPDLDHDGQILDLEWGRGAMREWFETGANLREQHNPHSVVGKGLTLEERDDGVWMSGEVGDDQSGRKLERGYFHGLSVGVRDAVIDRSSKALAKAKGGIVCGGRIVEVSLVDRPANPTAKLALAKADGDGNCAFVEEEVKLSKAESVQHSHSHSHGEDGHRHQHRHGPEVAEHRSMDSDVRHSHNHSEEEEASLCPMDDDKAEGVDKARLNTRQRDALKDSDFALPDSREYPIQDEDHAHKALQLLHNASPEEQKKIKAAVHRRYPDIKIEDDDDKAAVATLTKRLDAMSAQLADLLKARPAKPTSADPDPDGNGDDDRTPEGDTDHDYWNEDGTPTAKGKAAGLKESRRKGGRRKADHEVGKAVDAAIKRTEAVVLEKVAGLEAQLQEVQKMAAPGGPARTRPPMAQQVSAEADRLRMERDQYEGFARELDGTNSDLAKSYRKMVLTRTEQLEKLVG